MSFCVIIFLDFLKKVFVSFSFKILQLRKTFINNFTRSDFQLIKSKNLLPHLNKLQLGVGLNASK